MYRLENVLLQVVSTIVLVATLAFVGCAATDPYDNWAPIQPDLIGTWQRVTYEEYEYYNQNRDDPSVWLTYDKPLEIVEISLETITKHQWIGTCYKTETRSYYLRYDMGGETRMMNKNGYFSGKEENEGGQTRWATYVQLDDSDDENDEQLAIIKVETTAASELTYNREQVYYYTPYDGEIPPADWPTTPCD